MTEKEGFEVGYASLYWQQFDREMAVSERDVEFVKLAWILKEQTRRGSKVCSEVTPQLFQVAGLR